MTHDDDGTDVDVRTDFEIDADFSPLEDVLSPGSAPAAAKTIEALLPMLLECRKSEIERRLAVTLFKNDLVENALRNGRLFDVRIFDVVGVLQIIICPVPQEPEVPPGDVIAPTGAHRM